MEPALLPPASTAPPPTADNGFDFSSHAEKLKSTPKQDYSSSIPKPEPEPEPDPAPGSSSTGSGASSGPDAPPPGTDGGGQEYTKEHLDSARATLMIYDTTVAGLCEALVDDPKYPAERFMMKPLVRTQAEQQLARGIAKGGGKFSMPWWLALCILLAFAGFLNWQMVKKARKEKAERSRPRPTPAAPPPGAPHTAGQPIAPSAIHDAAGKRVDVPPPPPATYGECAQCGRPLTKKGKKYCSQSCSGQARTKQPKQADGTAS